MGAPIPQTKRAYKRSSLIWPFALMTGLVILKTAFEHHPRVMKVEAWTYQQLQRKLVHEGVKERPDVLVINISSKIKQAIVDQNDRSEFVTPREPLEQLLRVFTDLKAKSIGIDIDFSPKEGRWMDSGDPTFFDRCLKLRDDSGIPIFLGVDRTRGRADKWLGDDRYMSLAAAIASPVGEHQQAVLWFSPDKARTPLLSMAAGLAGFEFKFDGEHSFWSWAVESISRIRRQPDLFSTEFTIDFASLEWIKDNALTVLTPEEFADMKEKIRGRMVLIGDTKPDTGDLFNVAGLGQIPGVFLHACAAHTLARQPLYHLTLLGRIVIDVIMASFLFGLVQFSLWLARCNHSNFVHAEHPLSYLFAAIAVLVISVVSIYWVHKTRLLWTDFILFCAGLLAHPMVDSIVAVARRIITAVMNYYSRAAAAAALLLMLAATSGCEEKTVTAPPTDSISSAPQVSVSPPSPTPAYSRAGRYAEQSPGNEEIMATGSPTEDAVAGRARIIRPAAAPAGRPEAQPKPPPRP
jgi:CHASE2 domain-containing sensor protein